MCGIVGFLDHRTREDKKPIIEEMMEAIIHRGPVSAGHYLDESIALGFRRLSIIDLAGGDQPLYNEDRSMVLTFNGEIYNYQELREDLLSKGHHFTTKTDSEVLIHGYEEYGPNLLKKLRGMFAFVIWDQKKKELFGARDHFGIKPLYYTQMGNSFIYGSEIKALLRHPDFNKVLNKKALKPYLTFEYSGLKETFFKGVYRLEEGHYFVYREGELEIQQYWDASPREEEMTLQEAVAAIEQAVEESVNAHKIADVEVGSFLSSGVDSSYVAALLKPDKTYSVGFGEHSYNESREAKMLADLLGIENRSLLLSGQQAFEEFPLIQYYLDEPDANPSLIPLYFLSELASRDVRVVMSGEGADELFGGYTNYGFNSNSRLILKIGEVCRKLPEKLRHSLANLMDHLPNFKGKMHLHSTLKDPSKSFAGHSWVFDEDEADLYINSDYQESIPVFDIVAEYYQKAQGLSDLKKMEYVDLHHWMPKNILLKADRMSMAHSLEVRTPLLDIRMMELAERIPTKFQINEYNTKYAFRLAAERHLPKEWSQRPKLGFPVPIKDWLRDETYYQHIKETFSQDFVREFFNQDKILQLLEDNYQGRVKAQRKIWTLYTFLTWYDVYFLNDGRKPNKQKF